ncbi:hypothetical protein BDN72DRAFT_906832 [Pluteus cervinus]|uniref:Uncharacterized protein n=1 Tax=Pluteus cervinus TaxID=181527 RepID=A0ACD3A0D0_9AGAR|nr:hypothetical protein BDN72DRAFT_906832 [Pluteus cervinus]
MSQVRDNLTDSEVNMAVALTELDDISLTLRSTHIALTESKEKIISIRDRLSVAIKDYRQKKLDKNVVALWAQIGELINEFNILRQATGMPLPPTPAPAPAPPLPPAPPPPAPTVSTETEDSDKDHQLPFISDDELTYPFVIGTPSLADNEREGASDSRQSKLIPWVFFLLRSH